MNAVTMSEKEATHLKESWERHVVESEGEERKRRNVIILESQKLTNNIIQGGKKFSEKYTLFTFQLYLIVFTHGILGFLVSA